MITKKRLVAVSGALAAAGIATFAVGMGYRAPEVHAVGESTPTPTTDPCVQLTRNLHPAAGVHYVGFSAGEPVCTATPSATVRVATKTPTATGTAEPTNTLPPATATTAPQPSATSPSGGAGAGGVRPPNTGTGGGDSGTGLWLWLAAGGAALAALGGAGIAAGTLRRR
jgi:hypothetical protein